MKQKLVFFPDSFPVYSFQQLAVYKENIASLSQANLRKPQWYNVLIHEL